MALTTGMGAAVRPRRAHALPLVVGVILAACVGCQPPRAANYNVNEHNFARVRLATGEAEVATILGNPDACGQGEIVCVPGDAAGDVLYTIAETCEKPGKDYFKFFRGLNDEQIRLLVSGETGKIIAAEYLVDDTPVYYRGPKTGGRTVEVLRGGRDREDARFLARRKELIEFFQARQETAEAPAASPRPALADRKTYGQPEGLRYSVDYAQVKSHAFVVRVKVENITENRKVSYAPCQPTLRDFVGNNYANKAAPRDECKSVYPHQKFFLDYVFEEPVESAEAFFLTFSRQAQDPQTHLFQELVTVIGFDKGQIVQVTPEEAARKAAPRWLVSLPKAFTLSPEMTDPPPDWIDKFYPRGSAPWVDTFPDGTPRAVISLCGGVLHGAATALYRNGNLSTLALYWQGSLAGPLRLWDEDGNMVLYAEYVNGKRDGLTVAFEGDKPVLVQAWKGGRLAKEYLVAGDTAKPVGEGRESEELGRIHKQLKALTAQIAQNGERLKKFVRTMAVRGGPMRPGQPGGGSAGSSAVQVRDLLSDACGAGFQRNESDGPRAEDGAEGQAEKGVR